MTNFDFENHVALIGGGGGGIGVAVARRFLESGAKVAIIGRNQSRLDEAVSQLDGLGLPCDALRTFTADLSHWEEQKQIAEQVQQSLGELDIVVNSAGLWELMPIEGLGDDLLNDFVDTNLKTVIYGVKMARHFLRQGGSVIILGSFAGMIPMAKASVYSALKSAVCSFTRSAAAELAPHGIRVNCVIPGVIRTPMTSDYIDQNYDKIINPISMGRVGDAVEVADGILFLCSDRASYITGATLEITGGKFSTQP